ncbi:alpha/beta-hydrolase [Mollisia scopiformis]|uniref:Alpha/beta-hydrolase n=1 Tax=Mollisia scopiformis TaxID=149040 RepID=A0A194XBV7_MOLSC|nr:alpha/beta-hydrolase [Mollisia scopiformis]KUJ17237.1 alpha/beta-hydrolase [Mollisia scopiformis]
MTANPWLTSTAHSELVSVGTHRLHLQASGPARNPGHIVTIIIQGLSATISSWAAVTRLLSPHIRTFTYSRSGFHPSEPSPLPPTAENIALELDLLLQSAGIDPPYVLVAHSWGGILAREFIARKKEGDLAGVVFVEANQERTLDALDWRPFFLWCVVGKVEFLKVSDLEKRRKLDDEEWERHLRDMRDEGNRIQGEKEWNEYEKSFESLTEKKGSSVDMLRHIPVSVVKGENGRGLRMLYDALIERGHGTEEDREKFKGFLETFDEKDVELQSEIGKLSSKGRYVEARKSGHDVQLTEPEVIVEEVKWVVAQFVEGID